MAEKQHEGVRPKTSSIEMDFYYRHQRCRERVKLPPTKANIQHCIHWRARILHEIAKNEFIYVNHFPDSPRAQRFLAPGDKITVQDYLTTWFDQEREFLQPATAKGYSKILKYYLVPAFGTVTLQELTSKRVIDAVNAWGVRRKTVRNRLSPLRIAMDAALADELITQNPLRGLKIRKRRTEQSASRIPDPFNADERNAILDALSGQSRNLVEFWFWSGLRTSELLGSNWSDINFSKSEIRIERRLTEAMDEPEEGTKTSAGKRIVKLLAPAKAVLEAQRAYTGDHKEVFQNPHGERWTGDKQLRDMLWVPTLKKAAVKYRSPYQCRHTFASMMLQAGELLLWVSAQLGHTDPSFTLRTYTRWIPSDDPNAGDKAVTRWSA
jgi:integrase